MWNDVETTQDFLNFNIVATTVAELIAEAEGKPISIGVSGSWGSGKSSMVKMIGEALRLADNGKEERDKQYIFLEFNAWLYQGYDDARAALLQAVSNKLLVESKKRTNTSRDITQKVTSLIKRINWLQASKMIAPLLLGLLPGGAPVGGIASLVGAISDLIQNNDEKQNVKKSENIVTAYNSIKNDIKELIKENDAKSAPQQIESIRSEFADLLREMNVTLVVLVDDLDRCLPQTAISTLEAMRLLLFVERTAFIIAADEQMIRNSVKAHFSDVELSEGLVTSYFDKIIQIPLSVPRLGYQEVKIYLVMLFAEMAEKKKEIEKGTLNRVRGELLSLLSNAWQGNIPKSKIERTFNGSSDIMQRYIDIAEQLSKIMVTADNISGNPRLIKRFLNSLIIREKVARLNGLTFDLGCLVKMLLFERCAPTAAYESLYKMVMESENGQPDYIRDIEDKLARGEKYDVDDKAWESKFVEEWFRLEPKLSSIDIRPLLYLSHDRTLPLAAYDELSKEASEILAALSNVVKDIQLSIVDRIKEIGETEAEKILSRVGRIGNGSQWEIKTLFAALHITEAFPNLGSRLVNLLDTIPAKARNPAFIPLLREKPWAKDMLDRWSKDEQTPAQVKKAITATGGK